MQALLGIAAIVIGAFLAFKLLVFAFHLLHGLLAIVFLVVWILAMIDIVRSRFSSTAVKVFWLVGVFFTHVLGAAVYFLFGRPSRSLLTRI